MKLFVLVAAAAMTLASCQKNEINGPVNKEVHFTIRADFAETKTAITDNGDKTYTPTWTNGDKIGVLFALEESAEPKDFENTAVAGEEATFEGKHAFAVVEGASEVDGNLYAFYPSSAFNRMYADGGVRLDLKATQYPTSTSFDPSCDLLIAKPCYYMAEATGESAEVLIDDMYFARMMSVLRINLNSEFLSNETVKSISFDADGVDFTGAMRFNLETGEFVGNQSTSQDLSEVKAVYSEEDPIAVAGEKNSAYLVVAPVTIPSGTALTFTIETENYDIVKTINAPADMVMPSGNIAVINLTIAEENCTAKVEDTSDYSGEWLITGVKDEQVYAASAYVSGSNLKSVAISIEDGQILEVDGIANCMMTLTKIADGDYAGMYTITDVNDKYLYAASSSGNQLKGATEVSVNAYWTVELQENGTYSIVASKSSNRNVMQFNGSDATNVLFNCYSSASQSPVTLYPYSMVKADTTPRITVEDTEYNVSADDETLEFSYTTKNIDGTPTVSVADGATMTNVQADAEAGIVTVIFDANAEEEEKTATLVLSYEGAESVSVTITQAAKAAEGAAYYEKVTSAPADWSGEYLLVYESDKYLFDGSLTDVDSSPNYITLQSISDRLSFADYSQYAVTIEKYETGYSVKTASGYYIGRSANSNGFNSSTSTPYVNTLSFEDGMIKIAGSGGRVFNYNSQSGKFRFFASTNAPLVSAYKLVGGNEGGETPVEKTLESIAVSDAKTEYTVGDEFVKPTVTATYSDGSTEDVTASAEFTGYDMSAADTYTVTVSYSGKTTTYSITVSAAQGGGEEQSSITVSKTIADIATANSWVNSTQYQTINLNEVITATVTGGGNTGKYYTSGKDWRIYQNENPTLVVSADDGYTIKTVKITYTINNTGVLTYNNSNITSDSVVDVNAASIAFGVGNTGSATNGQVRVTAIEVVYQKN